MVYYRRSIVWNNIVTLYFVQLCLMLIDYLSIFSFAKLIQNNLFVYNAYYIIYLMIVAMYAKELGYKKSYYLMVATSIIFLITIVYHGVMQDAFWCFPIRNIIIMLFAMTILLRIVKTEEVPLGNPLFWIFFNHLFLFSLIMYQEAVGILNNYFEYHTSTIKLVTVLLIIIIYSVKTIFDIITIKCLLKNNTYSYKSL
jgi:isoprenylcysteine carboxyl methyltransferase (ICMT) family protein YpbQ